MVTARGVVNTVKALASWYLTPKPWVTYLLLCVTWRCNSRCVMCNIWRKPRGYEMSVEDYQRLSEDKALKHLRELDCTGGEPFLRKDLEEIIEVFIRNHEIKSVTIPTNGFLTRRIEDFYYNVRQFYDGWLHIGLSIDGYGENHDKIRGVKGAFKMAFRTYQTLLEICEEDEKFTTGVYATVIGKQNIDDIPKLKKLFGQGFNFRLSCSNPNLSNSPEWMKHEEEVIKKFERYLKLYNKSKSKSIKYIHHFLPQYYRKPWQFIPCKIAVDGTCYVHPNGDVYPCVESWTNHYLGNCLKTPLYNILTSEKAKQVKQNIRRGSCWCIADCMLLRNVKLDPRFYRFLLSDWS